MVSRLNHQDSICSQLSRAAKNGDAELLRNLIQDGADPSLCDGDLYPIHLAVLSGSKECIEVLAEHDPKCLSFKDKAQGCEPLHFATRQDVIHFLRDAGCDMNSRGNDGCTAMHRAIVNNDTDTVVSLITAGASTEEIDSSGTSGLKEAVKSDNCELVTIFLAFTKDDGGQDGDSARHICAVGSGEKREEILELLELWQVERCPPDRAGCTTQCCYHPEKGNICGPTLCSDAEVKGERVLSLDGGGIRGLIQLEVMMELERLSGKPVWELFDWVGGNSIGGAIALTIHQRIDLMTTKLSLLEIKDKIFTDSPPFSDDKVDKLVKRTYGTYSKLSDYPTPRMFITSIRNDKVPATLRIFTNSPYNETADEKEMYVWEIARSTSAAPTMFSPYKSHIDGGIMSNNPTIDMLTYMMREYENENKAPSEMRPDCVVNIGSGLYPDTPLENGTDISLNGLFGLVSDLVWRLDKIKDLQKLIVSAVTYGGGVHVERAHSLCWRIGSDYYRVDPTIAQQTKPFSTNNKDLLEMMVQARKYIKENRDMLQRIVYKLMR